MNIGRTILVHLGDAVPALAAQMRSTLAIADGLVDGQPLEAALAYELLVAESHEALRLIASAFRENLLEEQRACGFLVQRGDWKASAWNVASATALRSPAVPAGPKRIFRFEPGRLIELIGVDGTLSALRPALERCEVAPDDSAWERLLHASHQSIRNEAMAQIHRRCWGARFGADVERAGGLDAFLAHADVDVYALFNRIAAFDARQVMPFSKMRLDLPSAGVLAYAPEFAHTVAVRFAALRRSAARVTLARQYADFDSAFDALFPGVRGRWSDALQAAGHAPADYHPLPLHPLNEAWVREHLGAMVARRDLVLMDGIDVDSVASLSLRSMLLPRQCLKLPVPLQTTHLIRDVAVREIELGPLFSDVLQEVIDAEQIGAQLVLERDLLGMYADPAQDGMSVELAGMLGFVSRQNPQTQVAPDEHVIPVAAMFSTLPGRECPFFLDVLEQAGATTLEARIAYFSEYVRVVVSTQLALFFRSGVMLEAHQQNLNLVFGRDWRLRRLMYHDIPGGVAAYLPLLRARHRVPEALARLFYFRETPERSVFQFVHPTLTSHLAPLSYLMARALKLDRAPLAAIVRRHIEAGVVEGRALAARDATEAAARTCLIDAFEQIVLAGATLPGKMMLGRIYLQSLNPDWGRKVPNPELLSARVLVPPCDLGNFLHAHALA